jgi:hypothetical protein
MHDESLQALKALQDEHNVLLETTQKLALRVKELEALEVQLREKENDFQKQLTSFKSEKERALAREKQLEFEIQTLKDQRQKAVNRSKERLDSEMEKYGLNMV